MIGSVDKHGGLYLLKQKNLPSRQVHQSSCISESSPESIKFASNSVSISNSNFVQVESQVMLWHYRLSHPNFAYIEKLFPQLFINKKFRSYQCEICQLAKHTRHVYSSLQYKPSHPFLVIHSDIWGPPCVKNINVTRWFVTFIDDHTRTTWTFLMKEKYETATIFQFFRTMISTKFKSQIHVLKTDNAKDYFNSILGSYLSKHGIVHISSCMDTPQQNGVAERKNIHLLEVAHANKFTNDVPKHFWGEAVLIATYLINRMPSRVLKFQTPRQVLITIQPHILTFTSDLPLRVFGCTPFFHVHHNHRTKLDLKSLKCIFLNYSSCQKDYKCYSPLTRKVYNSMDVTFFESQYYFPKSEIQGESSKEYHIWDLVHDNQDNQSIFVPSNQPLNSSPAIVPTPVQTLPVQPTIEAQNPLQLDTNNTELRVYRRRRTTKQAEEPLQTQCSQSQEPNPTVSNTHNGMDSSPPYTHAPMIDDSDFPIAHKKGVHRCTEHPIQRYVAYGKLSHPIRHL